MKLQDTNQRTAWQEARNACKTIEDREALGKVIAAGWTPEELHEFARVCFFRNGKDHPTPRSYRDAIHKVSRDIEWTANGYTFEKLSHRFRKEFQARGSVPLPPRDPATLKRLSQDPINVSSFYWPYHTPEHRAVVEKFARERFAIDPERTVTPRQWEFARDLWLEKLEREKSIEGRL